MYNLVPAPKKLKIYNENSAFSFPLAIKLPNNLSLSKQALLTVCPNAFVFDEGNSKVFFESVVGLGSGYRIVSDADRITIFFEKSEGAFYALVTLWQIFKNGEELCCFEIEDTPDIESRGFMLDISRGRVPKIETIKRLADILARFKYNQLQLYIEGFSFLYPSFEKYCDESTSLTAQEIKDISLYCRERFIELVPNQNSLGHMASWLSKKEFEQLAECEGGFSYGGFTLPATTLDAANEKSIELIDKLTADLIPCFDSDKIHMGLDEPFEMGKGRNSKSDVSELFVNYANKLNSICKKYGKRMMMWSDALHRFSCFDKELPEDVTYLEWGYEKEYPFDEQCKNLSDNGLDFYVCPGTSSWLSFTGLTDNFIQNIDNAVNAALKYQAKGVLLTDWGDCNHMQPLPVSYAAIVYCSSCAWNFENRVSVKQLEKTLDLFVFEDSENVMGALVLDSGNYYKYEEFQLPCRTLAHLFYSENIKSAEKYEQSIGFTAMLIKALGQPKVSASYLPVDSRMDAEKINKVLLFIEDIKNRLDDAKMNCPDAELIKNEYKTALDMVWLFTQCRKQIVMNKPISDLKNMAEEIAALHRENWLAHNKLSGLDNGLIPFYCFE